MNAAAPLSDDKLTIISIAALACVLQDVVHEALGHGVTAWLSGAHRVTISTVAMQSDISTRLISANGTVANLVFAAICWLLLWKPGKYSPAARFFLVMLLAGNLFSGTGYFFFSGVANFGDWAAVIAGLEPYWMWRLGLVVLGAVTYYASMLVVAAQLRPFHTKQANPRRIRGLAWTPYFTEGILAGLAGLLNPIGFFYVLASAMSSTLGGNAGMLSLPGMLRDRFAREGDGVGPIARSMGWIAAGVIVILVFVFVIGRSLTWTR
ncbi:MAG: hypothetical protein WA755_06790 [Candidatus Acidiferrales bacterium]